MAGRTRWLSAAVVAAVVAGVAAMISVATAQEKPRSQEELALGAKAIPFKLEGTDGKHYALDDYQDKQVLVVVFTCNHCPYAIAYEDRFIALQKEYGEKGAQIIFINPNRSDYGGDLETMAAMKKRAEVKGFPFPYLKDETQAIARAYGARVTPHVYVFNQARTLIYRGTVDDNWRDAAKVQKPYLKRAIEAGLLGLDPLTKAIGCTIKWKE